MSLPSVTQAAARDPHEAPTSGSATRGLTEEGSRPLAPLLPPAAAAEPRLGTTLEGRYQIESVLGRGGMGIVYRARHLVLGTTLAVKLVRRAARSANYAERFLREARLASRIKHPCIVSIYDFGVSPDGQPFLVMELIAGLTLREVLRGSRLSVERACRIAIQLAHGMQAIHEEGVIHRDLKPENIFLLEEHGARDLVRIGDFGLAQELADDQAAGAEGRNPRAEAPMPGVAEDRDSPASEAPTAGPAGTLPGSGERADGLPGPQARAGTPAYMSPEQVLGRAASASTDQYSLGCVLYELLTGRPPFVAARQEELLELQVHALPQAPHELVDGVPESLSLLTVRMLSKAPASRLPSMLAIAQALERELQAVSSSSGPAGHEVRQGLPRGRSGVRNARARLALAAVLSLGAFSVPPLSMPPSSSELSEVELATLKSQALATLDGVLQGADTRTLVQTLAMMALVQDPEITARLLSLLSDSRPQVRAEAARAVRALGDRSLLVPLRRLLSQDEPPIVRLAAAASLDELGDPVGRSGLQEWMTATTDRELRIEAAQHLCRRGEEHALAVLRADVASLRNQPTAGLSPQQRSSYLASLSCLTRSGDAEARTAFESLARSAESPSLRLAAVEPLVALGNPVGLSTARTLMAAPGPHQLTAAGFLANRGDPAAVALCRRLLSTKSATTSDLSRALLGLAADGEPPDARRTAQWQHEPRVEIRLAAALATLRLLTNAPSVMATQSLRWARTALADPSSSVRLAAVEILGSLASTQAEALLDRLSADASAEVRRAALQALVRHPGTVALERIRAHLSDSDTEVRWDAISYLGRLIPELRRIGQGGMAEQGVRLLKSLAAQAEIAEQALASAALLRLGEQVLDGLLGIVMAAPMAARLRLVQELPASSEVIQSMLSDPDAGVRVAAARRLAQLGSKAGLAPLREASQQGGWSGAVATVLRARLGDADVPANAASYSVQSPLLLRLAALAIWQPAPAPKHLSELWQALSDPEPAVRRLVALRSAELEDSAPLLLALRRDPEPTVRAQAQALLGMRPSAMPFHESYLESIAARAAHKSNEPASQPGLALKPDAVPDGGARGVDEASALAPDLEPGTGSTPSPSREPAAPRAEAGRLLLSASSGTLLQLDDGPWGPVAAQPLVLAPGLHVLRTSEGAQTIRITAGADTSLTLTPGRAELAYARALQAARNRRYAESFRRLDEAESICRTAPIQSRLGCRTLLLAISFQRGQLCSAQHMLPEAMRHYQLVIDPAARTAVVPHQRQESIAASARLSRQLGRVLMEHRRDERCVVETIWMVPGPKSAVVDGVRQSFQVRAGETSRVGSCM